MIERQLKDYNWAYDNETQTIILTHTIVNENSILETIQMDRTRMFSLMRFMVRVVQCKKNTISKKQTVSSVKSSVPTEDVKNVGHQMEL